MDSEKNLYGSLPLHVYIKALIKTDGWISSLENPMASRYEKDDLPTVSGYYEVLGISNKSYTNILHARIDTRLKTYIKAKENATLRLQELCEKFCYIDTRTDFPDQYGIIGQYLKYLRSFDIKTDGYEKLLDEEGYESVIEKLDKDVNDSVNYLFETGGFWEVAEIVQPPRECPIRVLIDYDDRSVIERVNTIISNIQKDHANPIILSSEFNNADVDKYDLYYIIANTVSGNAVKTIKALSKGKNLHCIKVFSKDESFLQDYSIKNAGTNLRFVSDQNSYMYDIYMDLMEIIEERDEDISEFLSDREEKLDKILSSENPAGKVDEIDFNLLKNPISLYDKKSLFYRQFIDEYIKEQRKIAKVACDRADDIYRELTDMAAMYGIQMDVYLDYARYLFDVKKEKQRAIEYTDKYRLYQEYTGRDENNVEINTLLGRLYYKARDLEQAVECFAKAQNAISPDREKELSELIGLRASCLWEASRLSEAEEYLEEYLPYVEKCYRNNPVECKEGMAKTYKAKGNIIHAKRELESARVYFIKALKVWLNDPEFKEIEKFDISKIDISSLSDIPKREIASICNNLAILNRRKKEYSESLKYYDFCLRIREEAYEGHKNDKQNIDDYIRSYAISKANKATLLWQMDETDNSVLMEAKELFVQSVELKKQIEEKDNRFYVSMYNSYIEEAKFEIYQGYYKGAAEKIDKAERCIEQLVSQKGDNSQTRFAATIKCLKAKLEMNSTQKGDEMPSRECGDLLMSAFMTYLELYNKNKDYYLEEIVDTAIDLFEYYKITGNGSEEDIAVIYGAALPAANKLGKSHDVYSKKAAELKKLKDSL